MAGRLTHQDVLETEVKRRLGAHIQRRGDGFTEAESMGLLQIVRSHWREGWDVVAQLHNAQFAKHNRSADSLKKKFSRLYRSNIPPRGAKNNQAITFAHVVHKEMIEGVPLTLTTTINDETPVESSEAMLQPLHSDDHRQELTNEADKRENGEDKATSFATKAGSDVPAAVPRPRQRRQSTDWQHSTVDTTPLPSDDLLTSVLKVILRSQYQRDLDRDEDLRRREEERQRRREETEQRRREEERRRDEEREERRRRSEERAEERAENRHRHEQFMQMMMLLMGKDGSRQLQDSET
ncbi:uncharacterized protein PHALS_14414 [Plasmopara halstedii]|uniref:Uncharacterized protein n=1 Tax=Plasmopara halstedii TaxID=4781 RepID=A0A0P1ASJ4_PLAHL|nr:uncharacterized protein PHALS_14414 [Plasmopara halstedii]CEG44156.1 hypothetical protein PHALS_14414 [Plasmopara halstedii]|eukprot:XP_024580525.1 hypothetical protein PHALS_14414 [Plasmopara halstedii]